jgi:hypothetical protein
MDRAALKSGVHRAFEDALKAIDASGREPNAGEQACLVGALCSMAAGRYVQAALEIAEVSNALRQRRKMVASPPRRRVSTATLLLGLAYVRIHC